MYLCTYAAATLPDAIVPPFQGEVKRLVEQQNQIRAWRRVLETVEQNQGASIDCIHVM